MVACNDYIILESCIYRILKKHFAGRSFYPQLLDFFHEVLALHLVLSHAAKRLSFVALRRRCHTNEKSVVSPEAAPFASSSQ